MSPQLSVEIGFDSTINDRFTRWTDITDRLVSLSCGRGRNTELDAVEAGEATITFDNWDGALTPGKQTLTLLRERFNALGGQGVNGTFAVDTGTWQHASTGAASRTLAASANGVTLTGTLGEGESSTVTGVRVPVTAGTSYSLKYRAAASNTANNIDLTGQVSFYDASNVFVSTLTGTVQASDGVEVTRTDTFTAPTGAAYAYPGVTVAPGAGGGGSTATLTLSEVRVTTPAPYAGLLDARNPVRAYNRFDDNYLHYESVNADALDLDAPRWHASSTIYSSGISKPLAWYSNTTRGSVLRATDSTKGTVFSFVGTTGTVTVTDTFRSGLAGNSDAVHVVAGDQITLTCDVKRLSSGTTTGVAVRIAGQTYASSATVAYATTNGVAAADVWETITVNHTAVDDGVIWAELRLTGTTNRAYACNFKIRLNGVGSAAVAPVSGVFPMLRGVAEKWRATQQGHLSLATVECVDGLALLTRPVETVYRAKVRELFEETYPGNVYYWPCVEGEDVSRTDGDIGTERLTVVRTGSPTAAGFTSDKVLMYSDGESSGSFLVDGASTSNGAVLRMGRSGVPSILDRDEFTVYLWYRCDSLPGSGQQNLFTIAKSSGSLLLALEVLPAGTVRARYWRDDGTLELTATSSGSITTGVPGLYRLSFKRTTVSGGYTEIGLGSPGGDATASTFGGTAYNAILPDHGQVQFGGRLLVSGANSFIDGRIGHILIINGTALGLTVGPDDYDPDLKSLVLTSGVETGVIESESERIARLLAAAEWPGSFALDEGLSELIAPRWDNGTDANGLLVDAAEHAAGVFHVGPAGEVVYHNRRRRMSAPIRWTMSEWSDGIVTELDDAQVANVVTAERSTGLSRTARDAASELRYGTLAKKLTRDVTDADEIAYAAQWYLHRYRGSTPRHSALVVDASTLDASLEPELVKLAYGGTFGDRITITELPDVASADELDAFIEGVDIDVTVDGSVTRYVVTFRISDAIRSTVWVLEDQVTGVLDSPYCVTAY